MNLSLFLRALTVTGLLSLCLTSAALAQPTSDPNGGLLGFTHTGLFGTPSTTVQLPFSPTVRNDRARLDTAALQRGEPSDIYIPTSDQTVQLAPLTFNYLQPITKPAPPTLDNPLERKLADRFVKLRKITTQIARIVNPHIRTKNWDIVIQPNIRL